jgi:hypothetical protein
MATFSGLVSARREGHASWAALQGAADANTQLAQFYLNEAKQMFPVLSVDAARTATIVFQQPVMLKWGTQDARYEQQVKPLGTK